MVDPRNHNREDFVIDKGYAAEEAEELRREEYLSKSSEVFRSKSIMPYAIGGVGLIALVIVLVVFLSGPKDTVGREQLQSLEARIEQLENRMTTIGVMDQALEKFNRQEEELNRLGQRFNRLESTVTTQIDQILKDIVALHQKAAQPPAAGTQPAQPVEKIKPAASKPKEAASQYHQVQPGETLYRIGRRYGLTVEQLRSYNKLASNAAIYPGQKLKLSPDAKQ
jgi:LysM repeat protein